ncbi:glycoside hydrolase family 16 protein [Melanomma pulvis-pyrius CBS 109.77]|uniref:Crh-like protein n=1 Tax=Melanomma pulvis-pyrius CBS 109.77 TaxID=1314802 RepID=A0A6A6XH65_9PLEO|nr:glycoside hydrolase family 16 protein [Melanomma pulvis-pyrius CBS 109.77]
MRFTSYVAASAAAALASAQTFTACNPMEKECPNNPAIAATFETNFKAGADAVKGWKQTAGTLKYGDAGADFTIAAKGDAPTIQSEGYLHFGYIEVKAKAAAGKGIISSIVLQSEDLDEVDWEFIGGVDNKVQMNYFGKGNVSTYDRMIEADVSNTKTEFHTYALNWTAESLTWIIDSKPIRTLNFADANGGKNYPQTPSTVRIGIWAGGDPANNKGTIEWAGGETDYTQAPFTMTVESVKITNYSPGSEYKWTDKTGSFESIEVIEPGKAEGAPVNSVVIAPSATATGGGLQSQINVPTGSADPAATSPPCTTEVPVTKPSGDCGTSTVTITLTSGEQPPATTEAPAPPPETTGGIVTDTAPAPSVPYPTAPTGSVNTTTTAPPAEFTGAASHNKVGAFVGLMAGAAIMFV